MMTPGSIEEDLFLKKCVRCGRCMEVCRTGGLQPCLFQSGWEGIFTPRVVNRMKYDHGGCDDSCNLCGQVCPTGAIRNLSLREKNFAKMGGASIDRERCIPWKIGEPCLACDEICPYDSIDIKMVEDEVGAVLRPFVEEEKCMGCGLCERVCPVEGESAIVVSPEKSDRRSSGSYATARRILLRMEMREKTLYGEDW